MKSFNTANFGNSKELTKAIELAIQEDVSKMIRNVADKIIKRMKEIINDWYDSYDPEVYERTKEFRDCITKSSVSQNNGKSSISIFFDDSKMSKTGGSPDTPNGYAQKKARFTDAWGTHSEFSSMGYFFLVVDDRGWSFPKSNDGIIYQYDRKPAKSVETVVNELTSGFYDGDIKAFLRNSGWDIK